MFRRPCSALWRAAAATRRLRLAPARRFVAQEPLSELPIEADGQTTHRCGALGGEALDLTELDKNLYMAEPSRLMVRVDEAGLYGGQIVGMGLHAAALTVPDSRPVHSCHAYFLKPGQTDRPVIFFVANPVDGASFSNRSILVKQNGEIIMALRASFHKNEDSDLHHSSLMPDVKRPQELPSVDDELRRLLSQKSGLSDEQRVALERVAKFVEAWPIEVKHASFPPEIVQESPEPRPARRAVWMRARHALSDDQNIHRCAAGFFSDWSLLSTCLLPHGIWWPGVSAQRRIAMMASLDHSIWFHSTFRADDWVLYDVESPRACGGRMLAFGRVYNRAGVLCASVAQEGVVRSKDTRF